MAKQEPQPAKRILALDDDPDVLRVLKVVFESEGFETVEYTEADKALESLQNEKVDLFVLDEDTKGLTLGDFINKASNVPGLDVPLLVLCTSEEKAVKELKGFNGAADFLTKPVSRGDLIDRVRMLMGQERSYWRLERT